MLNLLVFGLTAPLGCDKQSVFDFFKNEQSKFNYDYNKEIEMSKLLEESFPNRENKDRYTHLIDSGNLTRKEMECNEILGINAITKILFELKSKNDSNKTQIFVVSSFKNKAEVEIFKNVFGLNFFLIGLHSAKEKRQKYLEKNYRNKLDNSDILNLFKRDEDEKTEYGQQMAHIFKKSDIFIDSSDISVQMERFLNLLHGHPFTTPTKNEFFMYNAYVASTRSASVNRQVGAVIVSNNYEFLSIGCNEVPKYGGGQYWSDDIDVEKRDNNKTSYVTEVEKIVENIYTSLMNQGLLLNDPIDNSRIIDCIKNSSLKDLLEFFREEHAEASAIIACARNRQSTTGSILYCTTFPCHLCLKNIISAGIKEVYFIEPYHKSKYHLFDDELSVCANADNVREEDKKVLLKQFIGIGPRRYLDLFSQTLSCGYEIVRTSKWEKKLRIPPNNFQFLLINFSNNLINFSTKINNINDLQLTEDVKKFVTNITDELKRL